MRTISNNFIEKNSQFVFAQSAQKLADLVES